MQSSEYDAYAWPPRDATSDRSARMRFEDIREGQRYIPHRQVVDAVNVARALGKPLLVVGEPGTGKTRLASSIAWQLGLAGPFKFVAKSTSAARDLFYGYDALARFYLAQTEGKAGAPAPGPMQSPTETRRPLSALDFIEYAALGKAILRALPRDEVRGFLPISAFDPGSLFHHPGAPQRSVVVIDEIDKAPRDFPNDLLDEIDNLQFRVPELNPDLATPPIREPALKPIIVVTSNRERQLPDAFLRRCVFVPIPFPPRREKGAPPGAGYTIDDIVDRHVAERLGAVSGGALFNSAVDFFMRLRGLGDLQKMPATAELLDWIEALAKAAPQQGSDLRQMPELLQRTLSALAKTEPDRERAQELARSWLAERPGTSAATRVRA